MLSQPLFYVPFLLSVGMLVVLFVSALLPMFFLPYLFPALTEDAHQETRWLDGLRGIAATTVALNHAPFVLVNLKVVPKVFVFQHQILFSFFGSIGVQVFFCITGMLFTSKLLFSDEVNWTSFFRKRLRRTVPGYFSACALALAIAVWYSFPVKQPIGEILVALPQILSFGLMPLPAFNGFHLGRLLGVNWSLAIEWRFYAVLPILFVLVRDLRSLALIAIVAFAIFDSVLSGKSTWAFFVSGAICAPLMYRSFGRKVRVASYAVMAVVLFVFARYWGEFSNYGPERLLLMTVLFSSIVIARPWALSIKPLVAMGAVSYSFYLLHSMVLFVLFEAFRRYAFDVATLSLISFTALAGATLAFATMLSTASYFYIERPFMRVTGKVSASFK
jgi:peptidoglycan/LPS O-acetylase OafA/YrhL